MILLFPSGGRVGNQLFQMAYTLSLARPREYIVTRGFGQARSYLRGGWKRKWINIDSRPLGSLIQNFIEPLCWQLLIKTGLASSVLEMEDKTLKIRKGKLRRLTIVKGFFETEEFMAGTTREKMRLKAKYISAARRQLERGGAAGTLVFIHIRKSDFGSNRVNGLSIELPDGYYRSGVDQVLERIPDPYFVIVGDSPDYAERLFRDLERKLVSRSAAVVDLALMSLCSEGILSNSTFAWWGAYMGNPGGRYIGPKYWWGWASGEWYPPGMHTSLISTYIEVEREGKKALPLATLRAR